MNKFVGADQIVLMYNDSDEEESDKVSLGSTEFGSSEMFEHKN